MSLFKILVPLSDLKVGDVFSADWTDHQPETIVSLPKKSEVYGYTWETDKHCGDNCITSSSLSGEVELHTTKDILASQVADGLQRFPREIVLAVLWVFCRTCGKRGCPDHLTEKKVT